jgi:predicted dienelactone hydrolase
LTVALASHGYVVAAPDHAGNTLTELVATDRVDFGAQLQSFEDRPRDLFFVLDALLERRVAEDVGRQVDPEKVATVGHSFGAVTALRAAGLDPRVRAAIAQAPAGYQAAWLDLPRPLSELGVPVMIQVGGLDRTLPGDPVLDSYRPYLGPPSYLVRFSTLGHFSFSDLCAVDLEAAEAIGVSATHILEDGCGPENLPSAEAFPRIRRFAIGALNVHLRGSAGSRAFLAADEPALLRLDVDPGAP